LCLFGAALASSILATGCQPAQNTAQPAQTTTQPAQSETTIYNRWEAETHRAHKEMNQRPPEEQKEYRDWRQQHPDVH
jgi:hypothetical protein